MTVINSPAIRAARKRPGPGASYVAARALLLLVGVFGASAATYFGFFADAADGGVSNAFDLFVALWKIGLSLVFLVAAIGPGLDRVQRMTLACCAMGAELGFDAIKIGYYRESAALVFVVVDCLLLALILYAGRTTRAS